ncbi:MAG: hypothetical protein QOD28_2297, partial [Acidobacteriota bacterium]|nr:hypothetical protein [Acidobacteriota bacterium]
FGMTVALKLIEILVPHAVDGAFDSAPKFDPSVACRLYAHVRFHASRAPPYLSDGLKFKANPPLFLTLVSNSRRGS